MQSETTKRNPDWASRQAWLAHLRQAGGILNRQLPERRERNGEAGRQGRGDRRQAAPVGAPAGIFVAKSASIVMAGRRAPEGEALAKELGPARGPQLYHAATRLCHLVQGVRSGCGVIARTAGRDDIGRRLIAWRSGRER